MSKKFMSILEVKAMIVLTGVLFILIIIAGFYGMLDEVYIRLLRSLENII